MKTALPNDEPYGSQLPTMENWSPTPAFTLRQHAVCDAISNWSPGTFLESGIGTGSMTQLLLDKGFRGYGYDITAANLALAKVNLAGHSNDISLIDSLSDIPEKSVDYLFAFEVLEHIVNDHEALAAWTRQLRPGGKILVSVPARMSKFRADDHFVGHVRRYEKEQLGSLLSAQGYGDIDILSYGVPLMNISRSAGAWLHRHSVPDEASPRSLSQVDRSVLSGTERLDSVNTLSRLIGTRTIFPFAILQRLFYPRDWGEGYIATATLQHKPEMNRHSGLPTADTRTG